MLDVADRKQLFIDHRFINTADNVELTVNPPVKLPGPVLRSEHPWEAFSIGWSCVLEDDGLFKLWYSACGADQWTGGPWYLCYAISRDGLTWEKPELGLVEYDGSKRNNIVRAACKLAYIFIDPNGGESDRYKMVEQVLGEGIRVGTSTDGLTWDLPDRLVSTLKPDTPKQAYWDARIGRYVAWLKLMVADDGTPMFPFVDPIASEPPMIAPTVLRRGRSIGRIEVDDLTAPWPEENIRTVLAADEHDPPDSDIYHPDVLPYTEAEDAYFMFPMTYQHFGDGETTVRNGRAQRRAIRRQPRQHPLDALRPPALHRPRHARYFRRRHHPRVARAPAPRRPVPADVHRQPVDARRLPRAQRRRAARPRLRQRHRLGRAAPGRLRVG